jgi:phosphoglycolate phosphatase
MKALIFDSDGSPVDSAEEILESLRHAFSVCDLRTARPLAAECVGPPIREMLSSIMDPKDSDRLDDLLTSFRANYDSEGFRKSRPNPGVFDMLSTLSPNGLLLSIVTNRRLLPTGRLIAMLGWNRLFDRIYSIDSFPNETHT